MSNICITSSIFKILEERKPRQARERFVQYYRDLHALYKKEISEETFCEGSGYSFTELGSKVLDEFAIHNELSDLDLMVVVYWTHEFDPDHSSCGPFFAEKYNIKCQIIDICDQGTISLFTGLHVIQQYLASGICKKALLLALEQTSVPRSKNDNTLLPSTNFAGGIVLQQSAEPYPVKLLEAGILLENSILQKIFNSHELLDQLLQKYEINDCTIAFKRNSYFYKNYKFHSYINAVNSNRNQIMYLSNETGYLPVAFYLNQLINANCAGRAHSYLVIDEDTETLNTGYILLNYKK